MLAERPRQTDATRSSVRFDPLCPVLAVMAWDVGADLRDALHGHRQVQESVRRGARARRRDPTREGRARGQALRVSLTAANGGDPADSTVYIEA
jgi:hypothetical protein